MNETHETIHAWSLETFGPPRSRLATAIRANWEAAELLDEAAGDASPLRIAEECADIAIVLCRATAMEVRWGGVILRRTESPLELAAEINCLLADLIDALAYEDHECVGRVKTVIRALDALCCRVEADLGEAIDRKMAANRQRTEWPKPARRVAA